MALGEGTARSIPITATGTLDSGAGFILSAHLAAAAAAATLVLRTGGSGGTILTSLSCVINGADERNWAVGVPYSDLHATLAGASAAADVEVG